VRERTIAIASVYNNEELSCKKVRNRSNKLARTNLT
jgi:hypothetical protein